MNPGRHQEMALAFGIAHMFYSEASEKRCTFNLVLDVDPVALVRGNGGADGGLLDQYVNDRPYAASSFLSVAIAKTLRTALNGRSDERQSLADTSIALEAVVTPLPVRGDIELVRDLFEPLGYTIEIEPIPLGSQLAGMGLKHLCHAATWRGLPHRRSAQPSLCAVASP
jgi:hypothetical protein